MAFQMDASVLHSYLAHGSSTAGLRRAETRPSPKTRRRSFSLSQHTHHVCWHASAADESLNISQRRRFN